MKVLHFPSGAKISFGYDNGKFEYSFYIWPDDLVAIESDETIEFTEEDKQDVGIKSEGSDKS